MTNGTFLFIRDEMNYGKENKPQSTQRAQRKQGRFLR